MGIKAALFWCVLGFGFEDFGGSIWDEGTQSAGRSPTPPPSPQTPDSSGGEGGEGGEGAGGAGGGCCCESARRSGNTLKMQEPR